MLPTSNTFPLAPNAEQQKRIRELFKRLAKVSDPVALKNLQNELLHLLTAQPPLQKPSPRQLRIIKMVSQGLKNHEIAENLGITTPVVGNYLRTIYAQIGVDTLLKLALWYEDQVYRGKLHKRRSSGI